MRVHDGDPGKVATVLPGRGYTPDRPLLHHATALLRHRGFTVHELQWNPPPTSARDVQCRARAVLQEVHAPIQLVIGKSLGAFAMPLAADLGLPGIWLTPVLGDGAMATAVAALRTPSLLVGGPADGLWDGALARTGDPDVVRVVEVSGADHSLEVPGDASASAEVLRRVVAEMASFVDQRVDREAR